MSAAADSRLYRLLGGAELEAVRQRLRRRFERADPGEPVTAIHLDGLDPAAYQALCQLTGRPARSARSMTLDLASLDAHLRAAGLADSLCDALERLDGPIVPTARLRRQLRAQWSAAVAATGGGRLLRSWLDTPAALTLLKRLGRDPARGAQLLVCAETVLQRLPAAGLPRSQLAAETLGDAHALDAGRPVATLVLAAWRHHEQTRAADGGPAPEDAVGEESTDERQRDVWARAGILVSELARPALVLNLPAPTAYRATWMPGEPAYLSLRQLLRNPPSWPVAGRRIFVCENPDIVTIAADRLGSDSAPLVCTDGMPAAAQRILLGQLTTAGARLIYHGDYDWSGIGIGNYVMRTWQARPWRFGTAHYLAAVAQTPLRPRDLEATGTEAIWDAELKPAMQQHGLAVAEEAVAGCLLDDLMRED